MQARASAYFTPLASVVTEQTIKQSRFICHLGHGPCSESIHAKLAQIRHDHPRASHLCWAYIAGPPGTMAKGMSDDGEPRGTAGRPMLALLEHSGCGEIWVAVIRYFGGIKLGKGGLIRAYTSSVQQGLELVELKKQESMLHARLRLDYNLLPVFERLCLAGKVEIIERTFTDRVLIELRAPETTITRLRGDITRISGGAAVLDITHSDHKD